MRCIGLIAAVLLPSLCLGAQDGGKTPPLQFPETGFSIQPLEGNTKGVPHLAISMTLPATDGFAPNVNVFIQAHKGTLDEYAKLSQGQFAAAKLTVKSENKGPDSYTWEFQGEAQGKQLHFYSKAQLGQNGTVYSATGTALESQWAQHGEALKKCVESFKADRP